MGKSQARTGLLRQAVKSLGRMATLFGLATLAVAWAAIGLYLAGQRAHTMESAEQNAANLARAFEEQIARSIKSVDQALLFIRTQFEKEPDTFDLQTWGQNDYYLRDLAVQLAVINADGFMRASNVGASTAPIDLSDREHFRFHVNRPSDDLFISKPVLGRVTNKWTIQLTRKLRKPDGSFGGVLVGSIDPGYLSQFYKSVDVGQGGGITLVGTDGIIRARGSKDGDGLGREMKNKKLLELAKDNPFGTYMGEGAVDGVSRIVSYRKVKDFPLIVTVAFDPAEVFAGYEDGKAKVIRTGAILTAFILLAIAWSNRQNLRLDATREALVEKSETLGLTMANMSQGVVVVDDEGDVVLVNEQALAVLELSGKDHPVPFAFARIREIGFQERVAQDHDSEALPASATGSEWVMPSGKIIEVREVALPSGGKILTLTDITRRLQYQHNLEDALERAETASRARTSFLANMSHEMRTPLNGVISMTDLLTETKLDGDQQHYVDVAKASAEHLLQLIDDILDVSKLEADQVQFESIPFDIHAVVNDALEITTPKAHEKSLAVGAFVAPKIPRQLIGDPGRIRQILINLIGNGVKFTSTGHVHVDVDLVAVADEHVEIAMIVEDTGIGIPQDKLSTLFRDFSQVDSSISRRYGGTGLGLSICRKLATRMGGTITVDSTAGVGTRFTVRIPLVPAADARLGTATRLAGVQVAVLSQDAYFGPLLRRQIAAEGATVELCCELDQVMAWLPPAQGERRPVLLADLDAVSDPSAIRYESAADYATVTICASSVTTFTDVQADWMLHKPSSVDALVHQLRNAASGRARSKPSVRDSNVSHQSLSLPLRILLAEDNITNQFAISRILENMGAQVVVASTGLEALAKVQQGKFDVVLMDMMMPEMDGLTATREIRKLASDAARIPIVALTANAFKEDQAAAMESGMDGYTTKPTNRQKLHAAITEVLSGQGVAAVGEAAGGEDTEIDRETYQSFVSEMGDDAGLAIEQFLHDMAERFEKMRAANNAAKAVGRDSHAIKSAAGLLGLKRLAKAAAEIEAQCRLDEAAQMDREVADLRQAFDVARELLQKAA